MTKTERKEWDELTELSAFVAECLGWRPDDGQYWTHRDASRQIWECEMPSFATDEARVPEMTRWLNERGYLVVIKQLPRGEGFLLDELTYDRASANLPAFAEIEHVFKYDRSEGAKEFRITPHVSAELTNADVPFDRYSFHAASLGRTVPEAMCRVIKALVERFPDLREAKR